jgi:ribosomal subunit interface protein
MLWENINVNLKATNMKLTPSIEDYVISRVTNLGKLLKNIKETGGEVFVFFEVGKTTDHHKSGKIYRAECSITIDGKQYYASFDDDNLYAAIDSVKDVILRDIKKKKEKKQALYKRGAFRMKDMLRGFGALEKFKFWK